MYRTAPGAFVHTALFAGFTLLPHLVGACCNSADSAISRKLYSVLGIIRACATLNIFLAAFGACFQRQLCGLLMPKLVEYVLAALGASFSRNFAGFRTPQRYDIFLLHLVRASPTTSWSSFSVLYGRNVACKYRPVNNTR